jgi:hypothetical protein
MSLKEKNKFIHLIWRCEMKLRKLFALLLLPLFAQHNIANATNACPSVEQIKHIKIVESKKNAAGQWVFISAPFQANDGFWKITFVKYLSTGSISDAQYEWDEAKIYGPASQSDCSYFAWDADMNWISADPMR